MSITETVYVFVALGIQHAMRCPALQHFSTLFHKRHDFRTNVNGHKMCISRFSATLN
jgi:hypothetical protein